MKHTWHWVLVLVLAVSGTGWAATIPVTTTEPGIVEDDLCSLAEAIENAKLGAVYDDCEGGEPGRDTILLEVEETYLQRENDNYRLKDVLISGQGSTISGPDGWAGFEINDTTVIFEDLTIRDAFNGDAAILAVSSRVTFNRCTVTENYPAVQNFGSTFVVTESRFVRNGIGFDSDPNAPTSLLFIDSEIEKNFSLVRAESGDVSLVRCQVVEDGVVSAPPSVDARHVTVLDTTITSSARGIRAQSGRIERSTISGVGFERGGVTVHGDGGSGGFTIDSSTFSGLGGPAVLVSSDGWSGVLNITNSTIFDNPVGIQGPAGQLRLRNNIVAGNGQGCDLEGAGVTSLGYNVISDQSCLIDHPADILIGTPVMLSELDDFGGPTPVHMPLEGSPVRDTGASSCPPFDQRGYVRPTDGDGNGAAACDSGAVEAGAEPPMMPPAIPNPEIDPLAIK